MGQLDRIRQSTDHHAGLYSLDTGSLLHHPGTATVLHCDQRIWLGGCLHHSISGYDDVVDLDTHMEELETVIIQKLMNKRLYGMKLRKLQRFLNSEKYVGDALLENVYLLEQRIGVIDSWIALLPPEDATVVRGYLVFSHSLSTAERLLEPFLTATLKADCAQALVLDCLHSAIRRLLELINGDFENVYMLLQHLKYG